MNSKPLVVVSENCDPEPLKWLGERATVVMLYMLPEFMRQLKPIVLERCKPGTRIVAHDYAFPEWQPLQKVTLPAPNRLTSHTLYLWVVGDRKEK